MLNFTRKVVCIWAVASITTLENYYNFGILDIVCWNLNDQTVIIYLYIWKRVAQLAVEKIQKPLSSLFITACYKGGLVLAIALTFAAALFGVMLKVFSIEGSVEYQSYCRWPVIYLILY